MRLFTSLALILSTTSATAQCGGSFADFLSGVRAEAAERGLDAGATDRFLSGARQDQSVLNADRRQGVFQKDFIAFSRALISQNRIDNGRAQATRQDAIFDLIQSEFGIPREVLLAFWAFETDYGSFQGDYNTRNALLTLAHDCRRPELFRPQVFAGIALTAQGGMDPARTTGAWAGEIGMVQMLPGDIIENGRDGDGNGVVDLKGSAPDALLSGASVLASLGWRANEPWLQEITVPAGLNWSETGLDHPKTVAEWNALGVASRDGSAPLNMTARVILPMGRNGPAFFAYPNFDVYFEWNQSFTYVMTAAYFATRLAGAPVYNAGNPSPALSGEQIQQLQQKLAARGYDVGGVDGILGAQTRNAIRLEQERLGLPADAWPTRELLNSL
ncbi:lytic murein transglycosylase [Yoonia sp. 208BN28-4]|uniref:lytic murein transglycosylase n=1 Tax=Yoonia sp. 208BN28-4 TaxID=3126505 RepID=UPI0030AA2696